MAILGGGLAGLTLAIQLKKQRPDTSVVVLEKREGPAPLAAFKVGESTVPAGAHYFAKVVGMETHLKQRQLIKFGLRFFTAVGGQQRHHHSGSSSARADFPPQDNYQIDRGLFENELATRARGLGVDVLQGCRVGEVDLEVGRRTRSTTPRPRPRPSAAGALGRRRRRPGEPPEAQARAGEGDPAHDQLRLAPARRRARPRAMGRATTPSGCRRCPSRACASTAPTTCSARATGSG